MPAEPELTYRPSPQAVEILCERLQQMGVSISEPAARKLLEAVLPIEGPRLDAQARSTLAMSLDLVRRAAESALNALQGKPAEAPRRDYELSFPPAPEPAVSVSGQRRRVPATRPAARPKAASERDDSPSELAQEDGPRPVFKRRRGR